MDNPSLERLLKVYEAEYVERNKTSTRIFERARVHLAGGVTGNMKLMRPYPHPIFFDHSKGSKVYDVDGHEYIDTIGGAGTRDPRAASLKKASCWLAVLFKWAENWVTADPSLPITPAQTFARTTRLAISVRRSMETCPSATAFRRPVPK